MSKYQNYIKNYITSVYESKFQLKNSKSNSREISFTSEDGKKITCGDKNIIVEVNENLTLEYYYEDYGESLENFMHITAKKDINQDFHILFHQIMSDCEDCDSSINLLIQIGKRNIPFPNGTITSLSITQKILETIVQFHNPYSSIRIDMDDFKLETYKNIIISFINGIQDLAINPNVYEGIKESSSQLDMIIEDFICYWNNNIDKFINKYNLDKKILTDQYNKKTAELTSEYNNEMTKIDSTIKKLNKVYIVMSNKN